MKPAEVILVNAGTGNLHSVRNALEKCGCRPIDTSDAETVRRGGRIVLPGVGAFARFMAGLRQFDLIDALQEAVCRGDPLLGICVGMQAFFEFSEEMGFHDGLGYLAGSVIRFPNRAGLKVPHTGWNQLHRNHESALFNGLKDGSFAYFNHSYYCAASDTADILAMTDYGINFSSMVQHKNIYGVQFHPEKSQKVGLKILENFLSL
ncbi:MAG: imidazole glycerol phosphate synthase subunit HisH [Chloroflexi bacterium]|nr:imidazole glycerol phosphate synthase subunit HisH [Chloroflexota bacterium]